MECLIIAGILFVQTPDQLITVDDIIEVHESDTLIELSLGQDGGWLQIKGETIQSLVDCLTAAAKAE